MNNKIISKNQWQDPLKSPNLTGPWTEPWLNQGASKEVSDVHATKHSESINDSMDQLTKGRVLFILDNKTDVLIPEKIDEPWAQ